MSIDRKTILFYAGVIVCLLPTLLLRDFTPANELRYLSIADEALRDGHLFAFSNHGLVYADKPPLYLWIVMLSRLLFGKHCMLFLSLFSVVPACVITEVMVLWSGLKGKGRLVLRLMMLTNMLTLVSMLTLRMDMLMCMFIVLALHSFYKLYASHDKKESLLFPLYVFLAVFTKGAVGFLVPMAVVVVFLAVKGRLSDFFHYVGWRSWTLLILLFTLWFVAVWYEGGADYLNNLVFHQTLGRAFNAFHHRQPFYYYLYMYWPLLLPWSIPVAVAVFRSFFEKVIGSDIIIFLLIASLSTFLMLSLISAKLSIYLLPAVPFAIAVGARGTSLRGFRKGERVALLITMWLFVLTLPAFAIAVSRPELKPFNQPVLWIAVGFVSVGAVVGLRRLSQRRPADSVISLGTSLLIATFFIGLSFPYLNPWIGFSDACATAKDTADRVGTHLIVTSEVRHAQNMDVYLGETPPSLELQDLRDSKWSGAVVILPRKDVATMPLRSVVMRGPYAIGVIPPVPSGTSK